MSSLFIAGDPIISYASFLLYPPQFNLFVGPASASSMAIHNKAFAHFPPHTPLLS